MRQTALDADVPLELGKEQPAVADPRSADIREASSRIRNPDEPTAPTLDQPRARGVVMPEPVIHGEQIEHLS